MKQAKRIIWGLVLIALGVLYGLNQLDILPFELFFPGWWTLFIIVPSIIALLTEPNKLGALIGLLFGVLFLLQEWNVVEGDLLWKLVLPVIIILVGVKLLFSSRRTRSDGSAKPIEGGGAPSRCVAVFSGQELRFNGQEFHGTDTAAIFGGMELFAGNAIIQNDCIIRATAVFGGVDIHLPPTVNVQVVSHGLFGGVENHRANTVQEGVPTVYVYATAVFGGVDIH